jgi:hypothetical protein
VADKILVVLYTINLATNASEDHSTLFSSLVNTSTRLEYQELLLGLTLIAHNFEATNNFLFL